MKKYLLLMLICIASVKIGLSQNVIGVPKPYIYQVFCNPKDPYITVKANGLNGVYIGCTVVVLLGARTKVIDLPVQYIRGNSKVVFYVFLGRIKFLNAIDYQQIIYSYTLALWTTLNPKPYVNFNINNPSTYTMSGLVQGSLINSSARNWELH